MKRFQLFVAVAMAVTLLSMPMAYAAPSPTEPDRPLTEIGDQDVPLAEIGDQDVPLSEIGDQDVPLAEIGDQDVPLAEIDDQDVPLAYVPAPQTGVTGLSAAETLTLAAIAFAVGGAALLIKTGKQTGPVR